MLMYSFVDINPLFCVNFIIFHLNNSPPVSDYNEEEAEAEAKHDDTPSLSFSTTETLSSWKRRILLQVGNFTLCYDGRSKKLDCFCEPTLLVTNCVYQMSPLTVIVKRSQPLWHHLFLCSKKSSRGTNIASTGAMAHVGTVSLCQGCHQLLAFSDL